MALLLLIHKLTMAHIDPIDKIVTILKKDGVILYPTDTIWGLGSSIYSTQATEQVYTIKKRERDKPLLLLADSIKMIKKYVLDIHPRVETLLVYHKQPLTIIYKANKRVPEYLLCGGSTIAIRIVQDEFCKSLINLLGHPITSTSANIAGEESPTYYSDIKKEVCDQCDYVVKYRQNDKSKTKASVLAKFDPKGNLKFLRV